jgi:hypothetical protein
MSEDTRPEAEMSADQGTESIGKSAYLAARDGQFNGRGLRSSVLFAMILVAIVFLAVRLTQKNQRNEKSGQPLPAPGVSREDSGISTKLLTEKDLTNVIKRPRVESSLLGKIKVVSLNSISELPIGSELQAILESGATDGIVKARMIQPLIVDGEPLLPDRTVLFGKGKSGEERLFVEFTKVIFPTGESFPIRAQAFDIADKILGLKGAFVGTRTKKMAGAMAFGFLGGMASGLQNTSGSYFVMQPPTMRDAALAGAGRAALDQSQAYIDEMKRSPNIIEVQSGTKIIAITDEPKTKEQYEK